MRSCAGSPIVVLLLDPVAPNRWRCERSPSRMTRCTAGTPARASFHSNLPGGGTHVTPPPPASPALGIGRILGLIAASLLALFGLGVITSGAFLVWVHESRGSD